MILALLSTARAGTILSVTSPAFAHGERIPQAHTCEGADTSPPLRWDAGPEGTLSYVLIVDDPDAPRGTFLHWTAWNLNTNQLEAGATADMVQGRNDFGNLAYGGPCPPRGHGEHRYQFHVYALDAKLSVPAGATRMELEAAMARHVRAQGLLLGTYRRD
jgi:Raf kinase inhibitor-like YbhB/YbcL family protein